MSPEEFIRRFLPLGDNLYRLAFSLLGSQEEAEDAIQDVFLKMWASQKQLDTVRDPASWSYILLRNLCVDRLRARGDRRQEPVPEGLPAEPPPEEDEPLPEEAGDGTEPDEGTRTNVRMTLDQIVGPGAMVSGDVVFSDGVKARWLIDQMGRFGLEPSQPGYRPTDADLRAFQIQLRVELQRKGYM